MRTELMMRERRDETRVPRKSFEPGLLPVVVGSIIGNRIPSGWFDFRLTSRSQIHHHVPAGDGDVTQIIPADVSRMDVP